MPGSKTVDVQLTLEPDDVRRVGVLCGKTPDEVDEMDIAMFVSKCVVERLSTLQASSGRSMGAVPGVEVRRRVYEQIRQGFHTGQTPLIGASDRELVHLIALELPSIRWARYWLVKKGFIREGGVRTTGKFWVITDKPWGDEHVIAGSFAGDGGEEGGFGGGDGPESVRRLAGSTGGVCGNVAAVE